MRFLEVTGASSGDSILVNVSHIVDVIPITERLRRENAGRIEPETMSILCLASGPTLEVRDTFDDLRNRLVLQ